MTFHSLLAVAGNLPFFDLATLVQLFPEDRANLRTQLSRWVKAGKIHSLRRGMYALAEPYRRVVLNTAELANHLYRPSYLSLEWALGFHGLIPEMVVTYSSVTTRVPRRFVNHFGSFEYRHIKTSAFFGTRMVSIQGRQVLLATAEKALLDYWYLNPGPWTAGRMQAMRFQNADVVDREMLEQAAGRFASPRLRNAVAVWLRMMDAEQRDEVAL